VCAGSRYQQLQKVADLAGMKLVLDGEQVRFENK
jgi:hypothetical protein